MSNDRQNCTKYIGEIKPMISQPLWIVGAPRSGTTFLTAVLNRHPMISMTNESRVFVLFKHILERACANPEYVDVEHRERFTSFFKREAAALIERYYREELGVATPIWGDKHPPYADPTVLSGRSGSRPLLPFSGSCLPLIRELFPTSKFIHIHRDPTEVAHSLEHKGWTPSLADGLAVWQQYVDEISRFFAGLEPQNRLEIAYADLLDRADETAAALTDFLGLADPQPIALFLHKQRGSPTPFSAPVRDLATIYAR